MLEAAAQWTFVGPDGTTVVANDGLSGIVIEEVTGFDGASIRSNIDDIPEGDGAIAGDYFLSSRPVTFSGKIGVGLDAAGRNQAWVNFKRAIRALRSDTTIKSQASGLPAMQAKGRVEGARCTGGFVKDFLISMTCADPLMYSQALNAQMAAGVAAQPGAAFPWSFPVDFGGGTGATLTVAASNAGNFDAPCVVRVYGPVTNPQIKNATSGLSIYVDGVTLVSGEWLEIDTGARTAVKNDGSDLYSRVRFPGSTWFRLAPGSNTIQLWATGTTGVTELDVSWRDAWE